MGEESGSIEGMGVEAVKATALEFYRDGLQPAVKQIGKGLETVTKAVSICLHPLRVAVWRYEQISAYLEPQLAERLANVDPSKIVEPDISIAGPALEAMRFTGSNKALQDLFAGLIATAMNSDIANQAHPSFVEIIKQLSSDEALLLKYFSKGNNFFYVSDVMQLVGENQTNGFIVLRNTTDVATKAGCAQPKNSQFYLENLIRLQLLQKEPTHHPAAEHRKFITQVIALLAKDNAEHVVGGALPCRYVLYEPVSIMSVSIFGTKFIGSCVNPNWTGLTP